MCTWPTSSLGWETWRAGLKFIRLDRIKKHDRFGRVPNPNLSNQWRWSVSQDTADAWQKNMLTSTDAMDQFVANYGWHTENILVCKTDPRAYKVRLQVRDWESPWWLVSADLQLHHPVMIADHQLHQHQSFLQFWAESEKAKTFQIARFLSQKLSG